MENELVGSTRAIIIQNYCHLFGLVILLWDVLITLDIEVQYLWRCPKSPGAILFYLVRYGSLLSNLPVVFFSFINLSPKLLISGIMIQRMAALYGGSKRVLYSLLAIAAVLLGTTIVRLPQHILAHMLIVQFFALKQTSIKLMSHLPGCHAGMSRRSAYHLAGAWLCLFLFDTIIFGLTITNAYLTLKQRLGPTDSESNEGSMPTPVTQEKRRKKKTKHPREKIHMPIHALFFRDGAMYFAAMAMANLANILTFVIPGEYIPGTLTIISVTMVSRLVMNVHQKAAFSANGGTGGAEQFQFTFGDLSVVHWQNITETDAVEPEAAEVANLGWDDGVREEERERSTESEEV
ncbi:hypothetical protein C8F01DRAFT_1330208 [Mycena amicta]|nr:hypothetical protein C8F01DRAFT_1330208 [Mycena amicta]